MSIYYNENGQLQDFDTWEHLVSCKKCHRTYRQSCETQVPGFREMSEDICPYCGNENGHSMSVEYFNYPLEK